MADLSALLLNKPVFKSVRYQYEYQNTFSGGWQRRAFETAPASLMEAHLLIARLRARWIDGTEFRIVEITETTTIGDTL